MKSGIMNVIFLAIFHDILCTKIIKQSYGPFSSLHPYFRHFVTISKGNFNQVKVHISLHKQTTAAEPQLLPKLGLWLLWWKRPIEEVLSPLKWCCWSLAF